MQCEDVMLRFAYCCRETDSAATCAQLMKEHKIGFLPVVDDRDRVVGVVTDRDLVMRQLAEGLPSSTEARELMTRSDLLTCVREDELRSVEARMAREEKRRAVVVDGEGHCVGVISLSDLAQVEAPEEVGRILHDVTRRQSVRILRARS